MEGRHGISSYKAHHPPRVAAVHPYLTELSSCQQRQLMLDATMPGGIVSIKVFQTPRLFAAAQPGVLLAALTADARVGDPQLPVGLPTHIHHPVVVAFVEALPADHV